MLSPLFRARHADAIIHFRRAYCRHCRFLSFSPLFSFHYVLQADIICLFSLALSAFAMRMIRHCFRRHFTLMALTPLASMADTPAFTLISFIDAAMPPPFSPPLRHAFIIFLLILRFRFIAIRAISDDFDNCHAAIDARHMPLLPDIIFATAESATRHAIAADFSPLPR